MPTTITSAGITFNDATTLTSANIGTAQLVNGSVTAAKLGTTEQKQIAKAWVNFNGLTDALSTLENAGTLTPTNGGNIVNWYSPTGIWNNSSFIGVIYNILNIGGSASGTLGGIPCSQLYLQLQSITNVNNAVFKLVNANGTNTATTFTSSAIVTGNGTSSGMQYGRTGIRSSYNVSSITKNGTGDYTVNFATPMADANYSVSYKTDIFGTNNSQPLYESIYIVSSFSVRITCGQYGGSTLRNNATPGTDASIASVVIFGN